MLNSYELLKGASISASRNENISTVRRLLAGLRVKGLTKENAETAASIYSELKGQGSMIGEFDILIASVVIDEEERILTRDRHFQSIRGLKWEKW